MKLRGRDGAAKGPQTRRRHLHRRDTVTPGVARGTKRGGRATNSHIHTHGGNRVGLRRGCWGACGNRGNVQLDGAARVVLPPLRFMPNCGNVHCDGAPGSYCPHQRALHATRGAYTLRRRVGQTSGGGPVVQWSTLSLGGKGPLSRLACLSMLGSYVWSGWSN
jgi:hypothetical protein